MIKVQSKKIRVRFAPAPTGALHIGGARTALFNYLFAKKEQGSFVLRLEDTDKERSKPEYEKDITESLKWLGIVWDEEYKQSERIGLYKKYLEKLLAEDKAYFCFCSPEELEAQRQEQLSRGEAPHYSGKCAHLSKREQEKLIGQAPNQNKFGTGRGSGYVIRFRMPAKKVPFQDIVRGKVEFDAKLLGDIVIAKGGSRTFGSLPTRDFEPLYNFAVVVDDFELKISHIIRGEDHLSNTPKQILLQEALGFDSPKYAHLPLILGPDRSKLSKRHGAVAISGYRKQGYLPEAIVNLIALLGWNPGTEKEIFSISQLIKEFSLEKVQKSGAVFNLEKLNYLNGFYIRHKSLEALTSQCLPYLPQNLPQKDFAELKKIVAIYQERLKKLSEITELTDFFFEDELNYVPELLRWKNMTNKEIVTSLDKSIKILSELKENEFKKENLEKILTAEAEKFVEELKAGLPADSTFVATSAKAGDRGYLLWPLRVALTGKKASATPFEIAEILGKNKDLKRLKHAKSINAAKTNKY